ncbi:hypothetical protein TNCV_4172041 [Trichonephila clavipes]|nr:hypothetical protein TNCV_4172041 [Trichonephila clavipes]
MSTLSAAWLMEMDVYGQIYLTRQQSNHQTFTRVYQNQAEYESFRTVIEGTGRSQRHAEGMLRAVDRNTGTLVRALAVSTERSRTPVYRVLPTKPYFRSMYRECSCAVVC